MAESTLPVDLLNPGHVFACLGILESAEALLGAAKGGFDWSRPGEEVLFRVSAAGDEPPVERVLRFLEEAQVVARSPHASTSLKKWKKGWGSAEVDPPDVPFPFRDPGKPDVLPAVLREPGRKELPVDYWGDTTRRDNVKFWAGSAGYPGAALLRDALELCRSDGCKQARDPFSVAKEQTSSFRFDWRRDNVPVQDGFSANKQKMVVMVGFPLVEVLAAIGLTNARPVRSPDTKLEYGYAVLGLDERGLLLEPVFHRAALGRRASPVASVPFRRFKMFLDWPGQEGQARSITQVHEEEIVP